MNRKLLILPIASTVKGMQQGPPSAACTRVSHCHPGHPQLLVAAMQGQKIGWRHTGDTCMPGEAAGGPPGVPRFLK